METRKSPRARTIAIALVAVALVASLCAVVVPNALLRSDFIHSRVNKDPNRGWLEYDSASSTWPGRLRVKNLSYRDRDTEAEWAFQLDEAEITYSLAGLFRKRFHVTRLTGRGLVFRARRRLTAAEATPSYVRRLPPITGFPGQPLLGAAEVKPPVTGREWTVRVDALTIDGAREIWVDEYRYLGEAQVTGGFFLRPKQRAEVFPARLATRKGTVHSGKDVLAEDVRATMTARIAPWNPREFPGSRMVRFVDGEIAAAGRVDDAEILNRLLGNPPAGTRLERGSGRVAVRGSVENGLAKGVGEYSSRDAVVRLLDVGIRGRLDGRVEFSGMNIRDWRGGRLHGGHVRLSDATVSDGNGGGRPWWGRIDFHSGEIRPKSAAVFTTTATARASDAGPFLDVFDVDVPGWARGLLNVDEQLSARASLRVGESLIEVRRLDARTGKVRIWGDYSARGESKKGTFLVDVGLLSSGIGVSGGDTSLRIFRPRKWFRERAGWEPPKH